MMSSSSSSSGDVADGVVCGRPHSWPTGPSRTGQAHAGTGHGHGHWQGRRAASRPQVPDCVLPGGWRPRRLLLPPPCGVACTTAGRPAAAQAVVYRLQAPAPSPPPAFMRTVHTRAPSRMCVWSRGGRVTLAPPPSRVKTFVHDMYATARPPPAGTCLRSHRSVAGSLQKASSSARLSRAVDASSWDVAMHTTMAHSVWAMATHGTGGRRLGSVGAGLARPAAPAGLLVTWCEAIDHDAAGRLLSLVPLYRCGVLDDGRRRTHAVGRGRQY